MLVMAKAKIAVISAAVLLIGGIAGTYVGIAGSPQADRIPSQPPAAASQPAPKPAAAIADLPGPIAQNLTGLKGICLDFDCGDGRLSVAVAKSSALVIFAMAKDEESCQIARAS